jgi:UDP-N-acetylglucosamine 2-epimerase (non-hydrolysing)
MKLAIVLGTRPEIIKLSSIIRECESKKLDYFIVHTNQHYSENMDSIFFKDLKLPLPQYNLGCGGGTSLAQISQMIIKMEDVFLKNRPDIVIVQGDTTSVLAGALVASRLGIKIAHVEAGLRSYDRNMPEEINRILTDNISDFFFCPTEKQLKILYGEDIKNNVFITGNTIVDAILWAEKNPTNILKRLSLDNGKYCLMTLHRAENVDHKEKLESILRYVESLKEEKIILPLHPRTKKMIELFNISLPKNIETIEPVGFLDMITLEKNTKAILTDSGGIQEEACILKKACITLRDSTERPETIEVGGNMLMRKDAKKDLGDIMSKKINWHNPFGNGDSAKKIITILTGSCVE